MFGVPLPVLLATLCLALLPPLTAAPYTSIHVFGDGACTTTHNTSPSTPRYGNRYCNGRVWIEVLCQWQGLPYQVALNNSYFGHDSDALLGTTSNYVAPPDVATALVIVWVNDADLVLALNASATAPPLRCQQDPRLDHLHQRDHRKS